MSWQCVLPCLQHAAAIQVKSSRRNNSLRLSGLGWCDFFSEHLPPDLVTSITVIPQSTNTCITCSQTLADRSEAQRRVLHWSTLSLFFYLSSDIQWDDVKVKSTWKAHWLHQTQQATHLKTAVLQYYQVLNIPKMLLSYSNMQYLWLWPKHSSDTMDCMFGKWCKSLCKVNRLMAALYRCYSVDFLKCFSVVQASLEPRKVE